MSNGTIAAAILAACVLGGCSEQQIADLEARANAALVRVENGVDWASAHQDEINRALAAAKAEAGEHPAAAAAIDKAIAANNAGNAALAHEIVAGGISITKPVPTGAPK